MDQTWIQIFKEYMDFIYINKRFPKSCKTDPQEYKLFVWSKTQRTLYTKNKLDDKKISTLSEFKYWFFDSQEKKRKEKQLNEDTLYPKYQNPEDNFKNKNQLQHCIIDIEQLYLKNNIVIEYECEKKSFLEMIFTKFFKKYIDHIV